MTEYLIHLPLWLVYDRETIEISSPDGSEALRRAAPMLARRRTVLYVGNAFGPPPAVDGLELRARGEVRLRTATPELDRVAAPTGAVGHLVRLRVYDVVVRGAG